MIELIDAQAMHKLHPQSFKVPSEEALNDVTRGSIVKLSFGGERLWVRVTTRDGAKLYGILDNAPIMSTYKLGDPVEFERKNIFDIWSET